MYNLIRCHITETKLDKEMAVAAIATTVETIVLVDAVDVEVNVSLNTVGRMASAVKMEKNAKTPCKATNQMQH